MHLAGIACVKNEEDIIEAFVRHNLALLDELLIIDDHSSDATPGILAALIAGRLPLRVWPPQHAIGFHQSGNMNRLLEIVRSEARADWLFALDADELLHPLCDDWRELLSRAAPGGDYLRVPWINYLLTEHDNPGEDNPVLRLRHHVLLDPRPGSKVLLPRTLIADPHTRIRQGNHSLEHETRPLRHTPCPFLSLAHYSIRQPLCYLVKNALFYAETRASGTSQIHGFEYRRELAQLAAVEPCATAARLTRWLPLHQHRREGEPWRQFNFDELSDDPLPYRGGPLRHTPRTDPTARALAVTLHSALTFANALGLRDSSPNPDVPPSLDLTLGINGANPPLHTSLWPIDGAPRPFSWTLREPVDLRHLSLHAGPAPGYLTLERLEFMTARGPEVWEGPLLRENFTPLKGQGWALPVAGESCARFALLDSALKLVGSRHPPLTGVRAIHLHARFDPGIQPHLVRYVFAPLAVELKNSRPARRAGNLLRRLWPRPPRTAVPSPGRIPR